MKYGLFRTQQFQRTELKEFLPFLRNIVPRLDSSEAKYFFAKMDKHKNGRISLNEA